MRVPVLPSRFPANLSMSMYLNHQYPPAPASNPSSSKPPSVASSPTIQEAALVRSLSRGSSVSSDGSAVIVDGEKTPHPRPKHLVEAPNLALAVIEPLSYPPSPSPVDARDDRYSSGYPSPATLSPISSPVSFALSPSPAPPASPQIETRGPSPSPATTRSPSPVSGLRIRSNICSPIPVAAYPQVVLSRVPPPSDTFYSPSPQRSPSPFPEPPIVSAPPPFVDPSRWDIRPIGMIPPEPEFSRPLAASVISVPELEESESEESSLPPTPVPPRRIRRRDSRSSTVIFAEPPRVYSPAPLVLSPPSSPSSTRSLPMPNRIPASPILPQAYIDPAHRYVPPFGGHVGIPPPHSPIPATGNVPLSPWTAYIPPDTGVYPQTPYQYAGMPPESLPHSRWGMHAPQPAPTAYPVWGNTPSPWGQPAFGPAPPVPPLRMPSNPRHPRFWFPDGNLDFLVEGTEYRVHTFQLKSWFARDPILEGHPKKSVDRFLSVLYPSNYTQHDCKTAEEWISVLEIATCVYHVKAIQLAVQQLALCASPVERIWLARTYISPIAIVNSDDNTNTKLEGAGGNSILIVGEALDVASAYAELALRAEPLTSAEVAKIGVDGLVRVGKLKHELTTNLVKYLDMGKVKELVATV
ncbi:hypothetical protein HMN09_01310100 [Mycena chlorophos]|uniref:BTB domain-containing protein n=1 Tax=Mycena chlorophos TaxID=658473 RepID=A0A8H6S2D6_MYCCL|nr:hypothetical protein HMN09_01310100 [Mycena chlorophos]